MDLHLLNRSLSKLFVDAGYHKVHDQLTLLEITKIKIANKSNLENMNQIMDYLVNEQNIAEKKKNGLLQEIKNPPQLPAGAGAIGAVGQSEPIDTFQSSNRGGQQRGRGSRGSRGRGGPPWGQHLFPGAATSRGGAQGSSQRGGNQGGTTQKDAFCIYCHKKYHKQEDCRSRIRDEAPCYSANGTPFYPKINLIEEDTEGVQSLSETTENSVFFHTA